MDKEELLEFVIKHFKESTRLFEEIKTSVDTTLFMSLVQESLQDAMELVTPDMRKAAVLKAGKKLGKLKAALKARQEGYTGKAKEPLDARALDPNDPKTKQGKIGFMI